MALATLLGACGQVITRPTPQPPTPTATQSPTPQPTTLPTETPQPYTPEPTATATVSPTPVVHAIASGETLIAVAQKYGISVAAIQEANGILDPRAFRVGQQLFIPTDSNDEVASGTPSPTPTPLPLAVGPVYFGNNPGGGLWALGEVANDSDTALEGVRLRVSLLDTDGVVSTEAETIAQIDLVEPGQRAPFGMLFDEIDAVTAYQAEVIGAVPAPLSYYYRDLTVDNVTAENERNRYTRVSGVVRNDGPEDAVAIYVVITLYDALDQVIAFRRVKPMHNIIAPGGETPFSADIVPVGGPVARSAVIAGGLRILTPTPSP